MKIFWLISYLNLFTEDRRVFQKDFEKSNPSDSGGGNYLNLKLKKNQKFGFQVVDRCFNDHFEWKNKKILQGATYDCQTLAEYIHSSVIYFYIEKIIYIQKLISKYNKVV